MHRRGGGGGDLVTRGGWGFSAPHSLVCKAFPFVA